MSIKGSEEQSKCDKLLDCIQHSVSGKAKQKIASIISEINQFSDVEKLLLYIQLPNGSPPSDPLKHKGPGNPFGKKADVEVAQTYTWIQSHLEEDPNVSLPKHEVYEEYRGFCQSNNFEPLCVADFGKAMKHVFPRVKPRRLGQRGNSKYCYSGLRKRLNIVPPSLPILTTNLNERNQEMEDGSLPQDVVFSAAVRLALDWAEKQFDTSFDSVIDLGKYLIDCELIDDRSMAALTVISSDDRQYNKSYVKQIVKNKRDSQINLQKKTCQKGIIKDQKKKLERTKNGNSSKKGKKNERKNEEIASQCMQDDEKVKNEDKLSSNDLEDKTSKNNQQKMNCIKQNAILNKVKRQY